MAGLDFEPGYLVPSSASRALESNIQRRIRFKKIAVHGGRQMVCSPDLVLLIRPRGVELQHAHSLVDQGDQGSVNHLSARLVGFRGKAVHQETSLGNLIDRSAGNEADGESRG